MMAFTEEDHSNNHKRKHDIDLHLGIDSTANAEADQTPTPTRFIRNCEEVGLFQDLQNVNPFDETFLKATELAKNGSLHLPEASSDDSLHTPHIFPHIEELANTDNVNCKFNATSSIDDGILKTDDKKTSLNSSETNVEHSISNIVSITTVTSTVTNTEATIKLKLKETLKSRNKSDADKTEELRNFTQVLLENRDKNSAKVLTNYKGVSKCKDKSKPIKLSSLERKREINRGAQIRSRERKKHQFRQLANEVVSLRSEIKELSKENQKLKHEVLWLKNMLLYHKDCPVSRDPKVAEEVNALRKPVQEEKEVTSPPTVKNVIPVHPTPSTLIALGPVPSPVFLQVPTQTSTSILATFTPLVHKNQIASNPSKGVSAPKVFLNAKNIAVFTKSAIPQKINLVKSKDKIKGVGKK